VVACCPKRIYPKPTSFNVVSFFFIYEGTFSTVESRYEIVAGNVISDSNGEYHVRVINYTDAIQRVEISIDDPNFAHPMVANGTYNWYINYNTANLNDGTHRIYVRTYNGDFYTVRWIDVTTNNGNVPEFSVILPLIILLSTVIIAMGKRKKS